MRASFKAAVWFTLGALALNLIAYVFVLLSPYPYPILTRILCFLAYWPAVVAQSAGASQSEAGVLILDMLAWAIVGFITHRFSSIYRRRESDV
jgi:hypothetical protein